MLFRSVVVVHEIPGITPAAQRFADEVADAGFTVLMPSLVGTPGREVSGGYMASSMSKVCVSREFTNWALRRTSPVIGWLRALARNLHDEVGVLDDAGRRHVVAREAHVAADAAR